MPFTVWKRGMLIGQTDLELGELGGRRRAGVFHPTPPGVIVLPALTVMAPALFRLGDAMKRLPLSEEEIERDGDAALEAFDRSPEGQAVLAAAEHIAELEVRDANGRDVTFESILISDLEDLGKMGIVRKGASAKRRTAGDPVRYLISLTLSANRGARPAAEGSARTHPPLHRPHAPPAWPDASVD
jgi:hypothetical protein